MELVMELEMWESDEAAVLAEAFDDREIETSATEMHTGRPHMPGCI
jgi:hypothetical protein